MPFHDHDPLDVQFVGDGRHWTLTAPLHWDDPERAWTVAVPEGFTTDFASVPRALWPVMPPSGRYAPAAVLHDFLYVVGRVGETPITRGYADGVLRRAAGELGVSVWTRTLMYLGVRAGGWRIWRRYRTEGT